LTGTNITGTAAGLTAGVASAVAVGGLTGLGTGVATALAVNVGSVGAPVVLNGALGTPSSGTLTNATGLPAAGVTGTALVSAAIGTTVQAYDATLASLAGLTLTEGALLTATGADAAAVLAKGTASQQLRMNVGATAPEWFTPSTSSLYIQVVYTDIAAASGNTEIPYDNTTPLSTEGTQAATLAITPADNTNLVEVTAAFNISVTQPGTTQAVSAALFRGTTCLSVQTLVLLDSSTADSMIGSVAFNLIDAPASSSAVTYSIRVGSETAGTGWSIGNLSKFAGAGDENQLILKEIAV
jgi:hypothetical protein